MKPVGFEYRRPETVEEAMSLLSQSDGDAKVIAGGQSLVPLMNFRLANPSLLVDINRIPGLSYIRVVEDRIRLGATTRQYEIESSAALAERCPILPHATSLIGHAAIRHKGTIGGSLSHNDAAAEYPVIAVLLSAEMTIQTPEGTRSESADDFFISHYVTSLDESEILTEVALELPPENSGWSFQEVSRRRGDFALVSVGVQISSSDGLVDDVRIALGGVGSHAIRAREAEEMLMGSALNETNAMAAAVAASQESRPMSDVHASEEFRRHLTRITVMRALKEAWERVDANV